MAEINQEYVSKSLVNQIASLSLQLAQRDAIIAEQQAELEQLRKAQLDEMNSTEDNNAD